MTIMIIVLSYGSIISCAISDGQSLIYNRKDIGKIRMNFRNHQLRTEKTNT